ncbi:MAG: ATP-binding cassette domain-containing protein [Roseibium sp.]|uniref:ABC transporter ATP-binding protein n=1 Tax=Roseibium sp. TaxID=1936156 RepID=UPI002633B19F|nr:oligopeptide/dipeptide ABC transporter ATP-binding protein [Roseibium sp.]MCV0426161.1 ATP-binding cassette domain-containing protein [Roseibium sp.]
MTSDIPLLELKDISRRFTRYDGFFHRLARAAHVGQPVENLVALSGINLSVFKGETVGIVGESGCGKTTLGRIVVQLLNPSSGKVLFQGKNIVGMPEAEARQARLKLQMVFQNPHATLNPRRRIGDTIIEGALAHGLVSRKDTQEATAAAMMRVGLQPDLANRFPHALSGGQRQRVGIARALAVEPECVVFDEAVAALDVSIQAQILNLLVNLRKDTSFTSVFISHDLNVVRYISDRVVILYLGQVVEVAPTRRLFQRPHHPYSRALLAEAPKLDPRKREFQTIKGELPSPLNPPAGCQFHPRCPLAMDICKRAAPPIRSLDKDHLVACHLDDGAAQEAA